LIQIGLSLAIECVSDRSGAGKMIGVDWGTTQLRAYQIDSRGTALALRSVPKGILSVSDGDFAATLESVIGDWLDLEREPILMSGMIGSRQGWLEVPYVACPATAVEVAIGLGEVTWGRGRRGFICPGLTCVDVNGVPDVMRGEEVQVFGALAVQGEQSLAICHPGTHSKHIDIHDGAVTGFTTFMTGELFAVLREHSILGRTMTKGPVDWQAFDEGITRARQGGGLLHHLFGARTRVLVGSLTTASESDYLSGILIGHEIVAIANRPSVTIVGAPELTERYQRGFRTARSAAQIISGDTATVSGLRLIWDLLARSSR
jgi:2-dehydro-3-deoxygalactonokinase